jgi:hypothetical protein
MRNLLDTVASQYANSPILMELLRDMEAYLDPTADLDSFFQNMWNVNTAVGYGLDVWGRIVGIDRIVTLTQSMLFFGFEEAADIPLTAPQPFDQAPFFSGEYINSNYSLADSAFRKLIMTKALTNITNCSIPAINQILRNLFGSQGQAWCTETGSMRMTYTFGFTLAPVDYAIIATSGVMPRPAGVSSVIIQL